MLDASRKPIKLTTSFNENLLPQQGLNQSDFNTAISDNGYGITIEKAMRCPCTDHITGSGQSNCLNCGGIGLFFINKKKTIGLVQHISSLRGKDNWSETDKGTIQLTTSNQDTVAFMDRVMLIDLVTSFSQTIRCYFSSSLNKYVGFFIYNPIEVEFAFALESTNQPLLPLVLGTDYHTLENKIIIDNTDLEVMGGGLNEDEYVNISVRYFHNPTYHIDSVDREIVKSKTNQCGIRESKELPIKSIAKKAHFVIDQPNIAGDSLFDNSTI